MGHWVRLLCLLNLLWLQPLHAAEVEGLYTASVMVAGQGSEPTAEQLSEGLSHVLVKVSGRVDSLRYRALSKASGDPKVFLQQYGYQESGTTFTGADGSVKAGFILTMTFDAVAVDQLLRNAEIRPLGGRRPSALVWVVVQDAQGKDYAAPNGFWYQKIERVAESRGLPIQAPILDLDDQQRLPVSDLWGLFAESVKQASVRYNPEFVLAVRLRQLSSTNWVSESLLIQGQESVRLQHQGGADEVVAAVINTLADRAFSPLIGSTGGQAAQLLLQVEGIDDLANYLQLVDYLKSLPMVSQVDPYLVDNQRIIFRLLSESSMEQLDRAFALQPKLQAQGEVVIEAEQPNTESRISGYRWIP